MQVLEDTPGYFLSDEVTGLMMCAATVCTSIVWDSVLLAQLLNVVALFWIMYRPVGDVAPAQATSRIVRRGVYSLVLFTVTVLYKVVL
jgi:hypothetical protein